MHVYIMIAYSSNCTGKNTLCFENFNLEFFQFVALVRVAIYIERGTDSGLYCFFQYLPLNKFSERIYFRAKLKKKNMKKSLIFDKIKVSMISENLPNKPKSKKNNV